MTHMRYAYEAFKFRIIRFLDSLGVTDGACL
jgi:hypothetical protein